MEKQKNNKQLTLAIAFVLGCCVFGATSTQAQEVQAQMAFDLEGITVEAARPDWESKLSPGSVTVIRPDDYKGEQKTLPDLMRKVPGVHVREVNGKGQYTTVTVRGSTAAQVGVFIDGVLSNLGGDSAVDLSTIPVANVERIEVYRGYIPARFAGTFIGGVINIVTKRPDKADVSVELGTSSYGGKKGAVEVTAPLGSGSLMFGTSYESSDGDFTYENYAAKNNINLLNSQIAESQAALKNFYATSISKYAGGLDGTENFEAAGGADMSAEAWQAYVSEGGFETDIRGTITASDITITDMVKSEASQLYGENWEQKFRDEQSAGNINQEVMNKVTDYLVAQKLADVDIESNEINKSHKETIKENQRKLQYAKNAKRWRDYNDYENINTILKWQNENWMAKAAWNKIDRHLPDSLWNGSAADALPSYMVDVEDTYFYDSRRQKIDTKELMLQNRNNVGKLEWGWMLDYTKSDKEYRAEHIMDNDITDFEASNIPLRRFSEYKSDKYNGQIDGTYKLGENNMLDFQVNYSHEKLNVDGSNMDEILTGENVNSIMGQIRDEYEQDLLNVQIQDTITLDDKSSWFLTPAVRYNRSKITGYSNGNRFQEGAETAFSWIHPKDEQTDDKVTWQVALKKEFDSNFTMRMTGGTYYRLLNMYEIAGDGAGILPAPNVNGRESSFPYPEEGKQFDISALWNGNALGGFNKTTLTYFWRDSENMLQLQRYGKDYWCYMNDNRGTSKGIELQTSFNWNKFDLDLQATYTKTDAESRNSTAAGGFGWTDVWATYQPEWEGNVRLTYRPESNLDIFAEAHYTDMYYTNRNKDSRGGEEAYLSGMPTDELLVFNTGLKWKIKDRWQLTVGCNDVFDKGPEQKINYNGYYINPEFPIQGRTYYATLKCDF
ncbi:MAG: TonB-dependent receptor [Phascolarctobacterium sp.]|nr:TonB-dependent receptor [Phascolarctobacterium sp.]